MATPGAGPLRGRILLLAGNGTLHAPGLSRRLFAGVASRIGVHVLDGVRRSWRVLKDGVPGHRFQRYHGRRRNSGRSAAAAGVNLAAGLALVVAGAVMLVVPGPGLLAILVGAGLFARESGVVARMLDRLELRIRALNAWTRKNWKRASVPVRILLILVVLLLAGGAGLGAYVVFFG